MSEIEELRTQLAARDGWLKEIAEVLIEAGADGNLGIVDGAKAFVAAAVAERDNWIETARMHAKNEAYYRDLIVTTLTGTPAAFVSDDGSVQQDVLCAKLPELYAAAVAAREEAERLHLNASALLNAAEERLLAVEARVAEAEADIARLERLHAACDATIRELTSEALAAVRGQEAAEARAAKAEERAKELFKEKERRKTWGLEAEARAERLKFQIEREIVFLEEEAATGVSFYEATFTQRAQALRAAIAAEEGLGETAPTDVALSAEVERLRDLHWREVESLRERLDKEEEERGRQYGMRVQAETEVERLMSLVQAWYEGRARIGAHMTFADQRFYDGVRCQRTGWPGDDASGDGGPPEES